MKHMELRLAAAGIMALLLTIMPMPEFFYNIRPLWVLLLVLQLQLYWEDHFNLVLVVVLGLLLDILLSTVMGEHMLALTLVAWIASVKSRRFYFFSLGQQIGYIAFFSLLYQLIGLTVDAFLGFHVSLLRLLGSAIISAIIWPLLSFGVEGQAPWAKRRDLPSQKPKLDRLHQKLSRSSR